MGKLASDETFTIERDFGEPFGVYTVVQKLYWTVEDAEVVEADQVRVQAHAEGLGAKAKAVIDDISVQSGRITAALRRIKSWNVTDDKDKVVPITAKNIGRLPDEVLAWITTEWDDRQPKKV